MNLPWDLILEYLFKYLEECEEDAAQRVTFIEQHPLRVLLGAHRAARKAGYTGRDLREARSIIMETITTAPAQDLATFCVSGPKGLLNP